MCKEKHTLYQPTSLEWVCPECNSIEDFIIEDEPLGAFEDCHLLHDETIIMCYSCRYNTTGKEYAELLQKQHGLIPCPHCKGTGLIKKRSNEK